jgi:hypothetical protein
VVERNYYGVRGDYVWHMKTQHTRLSTHLAPRLFRESDVVYCQGPQGGVRVVHVRDFIQQGTYGYVRRDSEAMKEFVWIKLRARELNGNQS